MHALTPTSHMKTYLCAGPKPGYIKRVYLVLSSSGGAQTTFVSSETVDATESSSARLLLQNTHIHSTHFFCFNFFIKKVVISCF